MPTVSVVTAKQARADAFVVGVVGKEEKRNAPGLKRVGLDGLPAAKRLLAAKTASLGFKSVHAVPRDDGPALVLVGLGDPKDLTQEKLATALHAALAKVKALGASSAATTLLDDSGLETPVAVQALTHGAVIGDLRFDQFKSKRDDGTKPKAALRKLQIIAEGGGLAALRRTVRDAAVVAEAVNDARLLANTPANIATPKWLAAEARRRGRKHGFSVSVKGRAALRREGFRALCGVAQGSVNEEQLITMDYHPAGAKKTLVVVGKGVCFDSGGISIKPSNQMWEMKYDKCGACNTIALMGTLKRLGVTHRVVGIVPAVENLPSGTAQRPGDIVTAKDGTTIEVLNTDAEGRLILADAITHGRTFKPDWMVDMATLTGACDVAVGSTFVAAMSKDEKLVDSFIEAARRGGDKAWPLPQGEEFDEANKGTYADVQNISLTNKAGTAIGGSFVAHFAKDTPFVHLDIASKAWTKGFDYFGNGPTGAGLRIVVERIRMES